MIKITEIEIRNYKSLINTSITPLGITNMFYGFNNCGKSNVFKFLQLIFEKKRVLEKVNVEEEYQIPSNQEKKLLYTHTGFWYGNIFDEPFLFSKNNRTQPITFSIKLTVSNNQFEQFEGLAESDYLNAGGETTVTLIGQLVSIDVTTTKIELTSALLNNIQFYRMEDEVAYAFENQENNLLNRRIAEDILSLFDNLITLIDTDRNFTKEKFKDGVKNIDPKNFKNWLFELNIDAERYDVFNSLIHFLEKFEFSAQAKAQLASNINSFPFKENTQVGFTKLGDEVEIMLTNENRLPLKSFGTGIQQYFYILAKIFNSDSKIIIIEELELNLSPLYQIELLRFLKELLTVKYDQIFFSSHSPFFTQKAPHLLDVIHHVKIGATGTTVDSYDDPEECVDKETGESYFSLLYS